MRAALIAYRQGFAAGAMEAAGGYVEEPPDPSAAYWVGYCEGTESALSRTSAYLRQIAEPPTAAERPVPYALAEPPTAAERPRARPLEPKVVASLRRMRRAGVRAQDVADAHGVSNSTVHRQTTDDRPERTATKRATTVEEYLAAGGQITRCPATGTPELRAAMRRREGEVK